MSLSLIKKMIESKFFRKASPFIIAVSAYFAGIHSPEYGKRLVDTLFYRNIPPAKGAFKDPAGLRIETRINRKGEREAYIYHPASGAAKKISDEMMVETLDSIVETEGLNISYPIHVVYDR